MIMQFFRQGAQKHFKIWKPTFFDIKLALDQKKSNILHLTLSFVRGCSIPLTWITKALAKTSLRANPPSLGPPELGTQVLGPPVADTSPSYNI